LTLSALQQVDLFQQPGLDSFMKIGELSSKCGLSIDTLRYYEKAGLIEPPWRDGGRRDYPDDALVWIKFLKALKATGMKLSHMARYAQLRSKGNSTSAERRLMLESQREVVLSRITELEECITMLDFKISNYAEIEKKHNTRKHAS
jgi:DNA-binding transcriptional MerR regulator